MGERRIRRPIVEVGPAEAPVAANRRLGPGDTLEISCPQSADYCLTRTLTPAGDLLLPAVPPIPLAKLTLAEASKRIVDALDGAVPDADISIRIVAGTTKRVSISGAVASPETMFLGPSITLQDLLASARPTSEADLRRVKIIAVDGETMVADSTARAWTLRAGDRVEVPVATLPDEVLILGGVERPGVLILEDGLTAAEAVSRAGGVSALGTTRGWRIVDANEHSEAVPDFHAASLRKLQPGDSVIVPYQSPPNYVIVVGTVGQPTGVPFEGDLRLRDALKAAGGVAAGGDIHHVLVRPGFGKPALIVDAAFTGAGKGGDLILAAGDSVVVPRLRVKALP